MLKLYKEKGRLEAGLDEAGRGSLIGRVYVGAVILPNDLDESYIKNAKIIMTIFNVITANPACFI